MKKTSVIPVFLLLIDCIVLISCSPTPQQINTLRTQIAGEIYASQTASLEQNEIITLAPTSEPVATSIQILQATSTPATYEVYPVSPLDGFPQGTDGYPWWNDSIFYEIFVRSFFDSDGDGIGDLNGITQKLDYLNDGNPDTTTDLGISGIWLMPIFPSPSYHGYSVTDYYHINPEYGTMEDFLNLLDAAHDRGIRVIIDLVINHTSNLHPWFVEATNPASAYHDWYIWSDSDPGYKGSWGQQVWFPSGSRYYYSTFSAGMPDLNFTNPEVVSQMEDIVRFWLVDIGVDGFRLDAAKHIIEEDTIQANSASTHGFWEAFRPIYKGINPDAMIVGEIWEETSINAEYLQGDELDLSFEFWLSGAMIDAVKSGQAMIIKDQMNTSYNMIPQNQFGTFLSNHDQDRVMSQLFDQDEKAKVAAALLFTSPGVPFMYYGEEIGMQGDQSHEWVRRPMQWSIEAYSGFSSVSPWQTIGPAWETYNVESESADQHSLLSSYVKLIQVRNQHAALRVGDYQALTTTNESMFSFLRVSQEEAVLVIINLGDQRVEEVWFAIGESNLAVGTYQGVPILGEGIFEPIQINQNGGLFHRVTTPEIQPYDVYILQLQKISQ